MPEPTRPTGQTSATTNPAVTTAGESTAQTYGRTRGGGSSELRDDKVSGGAAELMDHAKETISDVASQAGGRVAQQLDTQRDRAASSLGSVAQALRQSSDQIRDQNESSGLPVHQYVASAADQVERFSGYLRSTDVRQMMGDVEQFARRQPGLFLGGAFLLGIIGARFLKSSGESATAGRRSMSGAGDFAGRDDYSQRRPYEGPQQRAYSNQGDTLQYGSSARGSSSQYMQGDTSSSGQDAYRSGSSSSGQTGATSPSGGGNGTGGI